jgi:branched-chain amino acid transport system substrate-binding protein
MAEEPIKIAQLGGLTSAVEAYAQQEINGFKLGLEYATNGSMEVLGRPIQVIFKDTHGKPEIGKQKLTEAYQDDNVDLAVGAVFSSVTVAMLPVAEQFKKILVVEPSVANSITGEYWNRYIFRTGRNSSMDAIASAVAISKPGVYISCLAQDYTYGHEGVKFFKKAAESMGAKFVHAEFLPIKATDFTAAAQRIIKEMEGLKGKKYVWANWAGKGDPMSALNDMKITEKHDIHISSLANMIPVLKQWKKLEGLEGAAYYYYEIPKNEINDWLVKEHFKRFDSPPDYFTCGGMSAAIAIVKAIKNARSSETEALISAMEGMHFQTPKGEMVFRKEDHQALQSMYHYRIRVDPDRPWAIPELVRELTWKDMDIPILNQPTS